MSFVVSSYIPPDSAVEVIFDWIVGPAIEMSGDFYPAVAVLLVQLEQADLVSFCPVCFEDSWVQVVTPTLSALFTSPE